MPQVINHEHTFSIKSRIIPCLLTSVGVDPTLLMFGIYLSPNMVFSIPNPAYAPTNCSTKHAETIGPFTTTTSSRLKKGPYIRIARKSFVAGTVRALIQLHPHGAASRLIR